MDAISFTLEGKTAFFKKPEVNTYVYFTYGNIHKVALMGLFGAILGYGGYTQQLNKEGKTKKLTQSYPEFYEKLNCLKVAICPLAEKGFLHKKIQTFNNSVGYASKETGGNLIVKEQWLENPAWKIYVLLDCPEAIELSKYLLEKKCIYIPYLGKNDHPADIKNVQICEVTEMKSGNGRIYDLFPQENGTLQTENPFSEKSLPFKYQENLPYEISGWTNNYILRKFIFTDADVIWEDKDVYLADNKNIMFY